MRDRDKECLKQMLSVGDNVVISRTSKGSIRLMGEVPDVANFLAGVCCGCSYGEKKGTLPIGFGRVTEIRCSGGKRETERLCLVPGIVENHLERTSEVSAEEIDWNWEEIMKHMFREGRGGGFFG